MGNDYYRKHKSERHVVLNRRDRLILRTLLSLEIDFAKEQAKTNIEPVFPVEQMKTLYAKVSGWEYDEIHGKE